MLEAIYYQLHYPWSATWGLANLLVNRWIILFAAWWILAFIINSRDRFYGVMLLLGNFLTLSACLAFPVLSIWWCAETILKHWLKH